MHLHRFTVRLAALVTVLALARCASAQNAQPFGPIDWDPDCQPFAQADLSTYGDGPSQNTGMFFNYSRVYWSVGGPKLAGIGDATQNGLSFVFPNVQTQTNVINSIDTTDFGQRMDWGNRFEVGYMMDNHQGWLFGWNRVSGFQNQDYNDATVLFRDPLGMLSDFAVGGVFPAGYPLAGQRYAADLNGNRVFGPSGRDTGTGFPPVPPTLDGIPDTAAATDLGDLVRVVPVFDTIRVQNVIKINHLELLYLWRSCRSDWGSEYEWMFGAGYTQVDDTFNVVATGGVLADSFWNTNIKNNIIGPKIGLRWSNIRERWKFGLEGRFLAGANIQNLVQEGEFGSNLGGNAVGTPFNLRAQSFTNDRHDLTFAPVGDFRVETSYTVTQAIALRLGYTFQAIGGISRAANRIDYAFPHLGFTDNHMNDFVIANGVDFGIEINR